VRRGRILLLAPSSCLIRALNASEPHGRREVLGVPDPLWRWRILRSPGIPCADLFAIVIADAQQNVSLLQSAPGIAWVLGFTIASEIGDISTLPVSEEADGLYQALPARLPVRRQRLPRSDREERTEVSALGTYRGCCVRVESSHLQGTTTTEPRPDSVANAAPRSRVSKWPASSPTPSGTRSRRARCSLRQGPTLCLWSLDDPRLRWTSRSSPTRPSPPLRRRSPLHHPPQPHPGHRNDGGVRALAQA